MLNAEEESVRVGGDAGGVPVSDASEAVPVLGAGSDKLVAIVTFADHLCGPDVRDEALILVRHDEEAREDEACGDEDRADEERQDPAESEATHGRLSLL